MEKVPVVFNGKNMKYVLSVMDVFSRFHWLLALPRKKSATIAKLLLGIYKEHGPPKVVQHDQGTEFKGAVTKLCEKLGIRIVRGRPYHPQSQGKIERSHRSFRKKMMYDLLTMAKGGVNWAKALPDYAKTLNLEHREELSWKSAFEVYYGRKCNTNDLLGDHLRAVREWDQSHEDYSSSTQPKLRDYRSNKLQVDRIRKAAYKADERCQERMIQKGLRLRPPSVYNVGETVLIRYPPSQKKCAKRYVLKGKVLKRNLTTCKYKVAFRYPADSVQLLEKWITVNDITSNTLDEENKKKNKAKRRYHKNHRKRYLIPMLDEREKFTSMMNNQRLSLAYDPPKDGNCQFAALCHELLKIGIFRSPKSLRKELVAYLESHPYNVEGFPLELFIGMPWSQYLASMSSDGTFGDHLILQAAAELFQIQITVYSSLGPLATQSISPTSGQPVFTFTLGHFAEGQGDHYVCLSDNQPVRSYENAADTPEVEIESEEFVSPVQSYEDVMDEPQTGKEVSVDNGGLLSSVQSNAKNYENGSTLNHDVMELIIRTTINLYPYMRFTLRSVSTFFRYIVNSIPQNSLPAVYFPELKDLGITHVSMRKIIRIKGKSSALVEELKSLIDCYNWVNAWIHFVAGSFGWYGISAIYWKK